jgi:hypothetical protein
MIKKKIFNITVLLICTVMVGAQSKYSLPELKKQGSFFLDKNQMYVVEDTTIFIYRLNDFKLVKSFGKKGEGPQEFMLNPQYGPMFLDVSGDDILVHSFSRLSRFTKKGEFIKEIRLPNPMIFRLTKLGNYLLASRLSQGEKETMRSLVAYDQEMNAVKELVTIPHEFTSGKGWKVLQSNPITFVYQDKLLYGWENILQLHVMDKSFNKLYTIKHDIEPVKITAKDQEIIVEYIKTNPRTKPIYEQLKPILFPDYFPAMIDAFADNGFLYIQTFEKKGDGDENQYKFHVFDIGGKYLKSIFLSLKMMNPIQSYPTRIRDGYLLQLVENPDTEGWELYKSKISL